VIIILLLLLYIFLKKGLVTIHGFGIGSRGWSLWTLQQASFLLTGSTAPWALASDFQFHDHFTDGRTNWTSDQPVARLLPKHRINTYTYQTSMLCVGFEPTIPASERAKTCLRPLGYRDRRHKPLGSTKVGEFVTSLPVSLARCAGQLNRVASSWPQVYQTCCQHAQQHRTARDKTSEIKWNLVSNLGRSVSTLVPVITSASRHEGISSTSF
jgi:hypothetical protein